MSEEKHPLKQEDLHRLLGKCLLRLQQYERLMKALLSLHRLGGPIDELETQQAKRIKQFSNRTLGQLVEALFETFAVAEGTESPVLDDSKLPADRISMSFQFQLKMGDEQLAGVKVAIEELVSMRNELVHNFIERFNVWTDEGCEAALAHLHASYERIDAHYTDLRQWAVHMDHARSLTASFAQTPAFADWLVDGIDPQGGVDWLQTGIVRALRDALAQNSNGGWLQLDAAQTWLAQHHPGQTPERYGCKSWPQVLNASRAFALEYRMHDEHKVAWFRSLK